MVLKYYVSLKGGLNALAEGLNGEPFMIRFDPLRKKNRYTVTIAGARLTDTDSPGIAISDFLNSNIQICKNGHPPTIMNACQCGKNQTCPKCGEGFGQHPCDCSPKIDYSP